MSIKQYCIQKIGNLRRRIYAPSITYRSDEFSEQIRDFAAESDQTLVARYIIPNALIPQLHTRFIITTNSFVIQRSKYSELDPIPFNKIEEVKIEKEQLSSDQTKLYGTIVLTDETMVSIQFESMNKEFFDLLQDTISKYQLQTTDPEELEEIDQYIEDKVQGIKEMEESTETDE